MSPNDQIGILYSAATGIVLRTINPPEAEQDHLTWVKNNARLGEAVILLNKQDIGADDTNCPNLDTLIPYVKINNNLTLSFGMVCAIIDSNNTVIDNVLCCPILYQNKLTASAIPNTVIQKPSTLGYIYDPKTGAFSKPVAVTL